MAAGDYCQTLDLTDIATTWTETMAVRNKAQARVFEALQKVRKNLPFPLLGLDSDNGSEIINDELLRYCQQQQISFTRSRPYRKNDSCFVEQKNYGWFKGIKPRRGYSSVLAGESRESIKGPSRNGRLFKVGMALDLCRNIQVKLPSSKANWDQYHILPQSSVSDPQVFSA